ncbi:uncharacterized protein F4812DRAFT_459144 [Daldinia caldariorum]|uniref:uncharacterized protein n=1 Tax=Daldinia caldariorum TaxID=326644 RepID=UPI0020088C67|nr:uncharacterized protein F4812DRAFT_459144 [Daldinia caldariorum]KAI1467860.1 hypothetical protein F4812DRAFT_459144 [Daldinia caldariorum]
MALNIKSSMLKHWRNSSTPLSRRGSKKGENPENKSEKGQSNHIVVTPINTEAESPKSSSPAAAAAAEATNIEIQEEQMHDSAATVGKMTTPSSKGFSLHVTVHIAPENVEKFLASFKPVFDVVTAEPECLFFEVYKSAEEPGKLSWVENWSKDVQWFLEHQITKPYYKEYLEFTEPMFIKPREARALEPLGPEFSMNKGNKSGV